LKSWAALKHLDAEQSEFKIERTWVMAIGIVADENTALVQAEAHYVDWGAIIAGGIVAFAISSLFFAFGSAIGLSLTSFQTGKSASIAALVVAATLWFLWIQVSSFIAGGYVAGRMRRRIGDAKPHEVEMRDGMHGLIVWALAVVFASIVASALALSSLGGAGNASLNQYYVDKMLRSSVQTPSQSAGDPSQIGRAMMKNIGSGTMDDADQAYLVNEIVVHSGVTPADAQVRLDQTMVTLKSEADTARRYGILAAFLAAASLLVGAVAAWWAAITGGKHRNENVDHSNLTHWS
jgi:hypothetical protein